MATPLLISLMAFLGASALIGFLMFVFNGEGGPKTADRLDSITGRRKKEDEATSILRKSAFERDKQSLMAFFTPNFPSLDRVFQQADCEQYKPSTLFGLSLVMAVVGTTGAWVAGITWYLAPMGGVLMFLVPLAWLLWKRSSRLKKFGGQLSDALELVARALRAGHSLAAGMHVVAEEMPSPIADEFNRVYEEQNLGISIDDSLRGMCERVPNLDLRFFVTSVLIQRQTGGDLSEILDKIGYVIRERFRILGQVQALTAEGRLSGTILLSMPFGLLAMMMSVKPDYVEKLWTNKLGIQMAVVALIMQVLGALVIKKIVNIKV